MVEVKPEIWALMQYYNEGFYLAQSLYQLRHFVDHIVLVDGAFAGFSDSPWSTDRSNAIIGQFRVLFPKVDVMWVNELSLNRIIKNKEKRRRLLTKGWNMETEKRQWMLDQVPDNDYFMIADADEMLIGDPDYFRWEVKQLAKAEKKVANQMVIHHPRYASWLLYPRVYHKRGAFEYKILHNALEIDNKGFHWDKSVNDQRIMESVAVIHLSEFYVDRERMWDKILYNMEVRDTKEDISKMKEYLLHKEALKQRKIFKDMIAAKKNLVGEEGLKCK
jgi:hypothetical protein